MFKPPFTDDVAAAMLTGQGNVAKVPAACTSTVQPPYVCINKPFKSILRQYWEDYVVKVVKDAGDEVNNNSSLKVSSPTRHCELGSSRMFSYKRVRP